MSFVHFRLSDVMKEYEKRRQSPAKRPDEKEPKTESSHNVQVESGDLNPVPEPKPQGFAMFLAMLIILLPPLVLAAAMILIIFYLFV